VGQQTPLERLLTDPDDVADEIIEPELSELRAHTGVDLGTLAGEHQELLGSVALDRLIKQR
jgi:hypothetical protein